MNKKAQMEIIGLVVIVILISLGMLFMAQFALKESPEKKIFTRKGLAYSTISAVMKTTVEPGKCDVNKPLKIQGDLLDDCADYYNTDYSNIQCQSDDGGYHSCFFLNETIEELLEETLGEWGKTYEFRSILVLPGTDDTIITEINPGACRGKETDGSGLFPLVTERGGLVESVLLLCD